MPETKSNMAEGKAKSVFAISKEVNRQSTEILDYLKRIGVDVTGIMSKVDETVYKKVLGHFKSDIEEAEKHKQKLIDFKKKHKTIEINEIEADLKIEKEKRQKEDDEKKKKIAEEQKKKDDREKQLIKDLEEKKRLIEQKKEQIELEKIEKERQEKEKVRLKEEAEKKKKEDEARRLTEKLKKPVEPLIEKVEQVEAKKTEKPVVKTEEKVTKKEPVKVQPEIKKDKKFSEKPRKDFQRTERPRRRDGRPPYRPPEPATERKFERVTIKDDFKKFKKQKQRSFGRKPFGKSDNRVKREDEKKPEIKEKQKTTEEVPLSPEAEERKRDIEKKNKAKRQKYTDGVETKKRKKYDEEMLNIEIEEAIRETMAKMDDVGTPSSRSQIRKKKKKERIEQEQKDVNYSEGTYDTRVNFQTNSLVKLWAQSNVLVGVGMHPMWVVRPENYEEQVWYNAFCDVTWPGVLAAYGLIGLALALIYQFYYIYTSSKFVLKFKEYNLLTFFLTTSAINFIFTTFITYSYNLVSTGLWGFSSANFSIAILVYIYEKQKQEKENDVENERDKRDAEYINMNGAIKKIKNYRFNPNYSNGYKRNSIR